MIAPEIEARLAAQLAHGDERSRSAALAELFEHLGLPLTHLCLRVTGDPTDAEDAVQETFVDALRGLPEFRAEARFTTWIFRIAIRAGMRVRARRERRAPALLEHAELEGLSERGPQGNATDPSSVAQHKESAVQVLAALERLPVAQRTLLGLAVVDDMPQTEIAAILGIPVGTVYSRVSAARDALRAELSRLSPSTREKDRSSG